jgi:TrpR-related protein YerC/YecD
MLKELKDEQLTELAKVLLKLRDAQEYVAFLKDAFTESELATLMLRWKIVKMLDDGVPYTQIEKETGASSATIAKVSEFLKYGYNGYRTILERIKKPN